jgi:phosphate transport system protein
MAEHIVKSFGEELDALTTEVARMGGMAESMVADAVQAVVRRDPDLAAKVIARDKQVDTAQAELERRVIRLFALRQPMASDLRATFAALKISGELERIGDLAKNIARRSLVLDEAEPLLIARGVEMMGRTVLGQLKDVLDAYATSEVSKAADVWSRDEDVDAQYNSMFRELLTYMMEDPRTISAAAHLLFIAKNLERIGDHATNIAEVIHFIVTGEAPTRERPKTNTVQAGPAPGEEPSE